jgi:hypothetical protein
VLLYLCCVSEVINLEKKKPQQKPFEITLARLVSQIMKTLMFVNEKNLIMLFAIIKPNMNIDQWTVGLLMLN